MITVSTVIIITINTNDHYIHCHLICTIVTVTNIIIISTIITIIITITTPSHSVTKTFLLLPLLLFVYPSFYMPLPLPPFYMLLLPTVSRKLCTLLLQSQLLHKMLLSLFFTALLSPPFSLECHHDQSQSQIYFHQLQCHF